MVKNLFAQYLSDYFLETTLMIRSWIRKCRTFPGVPAANLMRLDIGCDLSACTTVEGVDRQQDQNSIQRFELDI
jgi:hypothetical protein